MLDNLLKVSSLSGAFLIFCGVLKLIIFYSAFNIDIVDFLSISEIITSFLDDINILIVFMAIALVLSFFSIFIGSKSQGIGFDNYMENNYINNLNRVSKSSFFVIGIPIILISILIVTNILSLSYLIIYILFFSVLTLLATVMIVVIKNNRDGHADITAEEIDTLGEDSSELNTPTASVRVLVVIIPIILTVVLLARHDVDSIYNRPYDVNITLEDNKVISCGRHEDFLYVGKTEKFVFVKDKSADAVDIINIDDVKKYSFFKR